MPLLKTVTVGPLAAASANNIALSQTPVSGTALTLNGATVSGGVATLDVARRISLAYGSEGSARTLRITGTNPDNNPIRETLAIPAGAIGTVYTVQNFKTVTEALPLGAGWTAAVTLGTNGVASSPWGIVNQFDTPDNISFGCIVSGTVNYTIEYTYNNPNDNESQIGGALGNYPTAPAVFAHPVLNNQTANADGSLNVQIWAWRLTVNSGATGSDSVSVTGLQGGRP